MSDLTLATVAGYMTLATVVQMDRVTKQNAALVEEAAAAAESMQNQAAQLAHVVSSFKTSGPVSQGGSAHVSARALRASAFAVAQTCRLLSVSRAGFYRAGEALFLVFGIQPCSL